MQYTIRQETSLLEDYISTVKKNLNRYGNIMSANNLFVAILQGTTLGKKTPKESDRKNWADNITEWIGSSFTETWALACNQDMWKVLVRCSAVQQPITTPNHGTDKDNGKTEIFINSSH